MVFTPFTLIASCILFALVLAQQPQGGLHQDQARPHQTQIRVHRDADDEDEGPVFPPGASWAACEFNVNSTPTCHDCATLLICKPQGGLLKPCRNPWKPFCNAGICSTVPSSDCVRA